MNKLFLWDVNALLTEDAYKREVHTQEALRENAEISEAVAAGKLSIPLWLVSEAERNAREAIAHHPTLGSLYDEATTEQMLTTEFIVALAIGHQLGRTLHQRRQAIEETRAEVGDVLATGDIRPPFTIDADGSPEEQARAQAVEGCLQALMALPEGEWADVLHSIEGLIDDAPEATP